MTDNSPIPDEASYRESLDLARKAAQAYYQPDGNAQGVLMSDAEFDALMRRIATFEREHFGGELVEDESQSADGVSLASDAVAAGAMLDGDVQHSVAMLSLDNVFSDAELNQWLHRAADLGCVRPEHSVFRVDPKLDGLALAIRYQQGVPVQLVTRGDGRTGEDITAALPMLTNLPTDLPVDFTTEVRGEALFSREQFETANQLRTQHSDKPFANARNGAAGALRGAAGRDYLIELSFVAYERMPIPSQPDIITFGRAMDNLEDLGFATARSVLTGNGLHDAGKACNATEVRELIEKIETMRNDLPFEIDGAVVKLDLIAARQIAGNGSKSPRWAIAYKYPAMEVTSTLEEVIWQVGRTGVITPRARITPVECAGTVIEFATLHNPGDMTRKGFMIGDTVLVKRAGEVIPRLEGVLEAHRDGSQTDVAIPTRCPRCDGPLDTSQERWRCAKGRACGVAEALVYAVSRDALDVDGLGKVQINNLVASGKVSDLADLFDLTEQDLVEHGKLAPKNAIKVYEGLEAALRAPFERVVIALGLKGAGRSGGRALARTFGSMDAILAASVDDLAQMVVSVNRLGQSKAQDVRADLDELVESGVLARLDEAEMTMSMIMESSSTITASQPSHLELAPQPLAGVAVCVTGTMSSRSRGEMEELVASLGGRAASSVSSKTNLLVAGPGAGSKLAKAQQLGIEILNEQDFLDKYAN